MERRAGGWVIKKIFVAILATLAGAANVLFGGGGGMLVVPALTLMGGEEKRSHASAIAVMLPLSVFSVLFLAIRGGGNASLALRVSAGAAAGSAVGALLLKKVPKRMLSLLFYGVMIYVGIRYIR